MDIKLCYMKVKFFFKRSQIFFSFLIFSVGIISAFGLYDEFAGQYWQIVSALCVSLGGLILGIFAYSDREERKREERRKQIVELSETILKRYAQTEIEC